MDAIIRADNLSKKYRRYTSVAEGVKEVLHPLRKKYHQEFWALRDLSFEIGRGESVGIIGRNGSGKSTLLQVLCGILQPTGGHVEVAGKVAALLELGAGFHPRFTGRENIFLNGALMGLTRAETEARFDDIVSFADIGDFIDQPVRTYSSGMFVRLAFAAAINVNADILVVDEALAVGDIAFRVKCMDRINELREAGVTILLVTQEPSAVKKFCDKALWLNRGKAEAFGDPVEVSDAYLDFMRGTSDRPAREEGEGGTGDLPTLLSVDMLDSGGKEARSFRSGEPATVRLRYRVPEGVNDKLVLGVAIYRNDDLCVCALNTRLDGVEADSTPGEHELVLRYGSLNLLGGSYYLKAGVFHDTAMVPYDFHGYAYDFHVEVPYRAEGVILMEHKWLKK